MSFSDLPQHTLQTFYWFLTQLYRAPIASQNLYIIHIIIYSHVKHNRHLHTKYQYMHCASPHVQFFFLNNTTNKQKYKASNSV